VAGATLLELVQEVQVGWVHDRLQVQFVVGGSEAGSRHHQVALVGGTLQERRQQRELGRRCTGGDPDQVQVGGGVLPAQLSSSYDPADRIRIAIQYGCDVAPRAFRETVVSTQCYQLGTNRRRETCHGTGNGRS